MTNVVVGEKEIRGEIKLLEKEVVERPALQSILKAKLTKDARDVMQQGPKSLRRRSRREAGVADTRTRKLPEKIEVPLKTSACFVFSP